MKKLNIKVMIHNGSVEAVLKDQPDVRVHVEIIDIDKDYAEYEELKLYQEKIYADKSYQSCEYNVANFEDSHN